VPKFSVYIPDETWDRAREQAPELNASQLVQLGLRKLAEAATDTPAFARTRPAEVAERFTALQQRFTEQARERYEAGYTEAVDLAESKFTWGTIDRLAEANWGIRTWIKNLETLGDASPDYEALTEVFFPIKEAIWVGEKLAHAYWPDDTWVLGFVAALRDLWSAVRAEQQPAVPPVGRPFTFNPPKEEKS
jgi:hypothetical protein